MADTFHFHVLLSLCSSKTKPNQSNNLKSLKSNGWWNNSNSSCLSYVSLLQSVTATPAGVGHSRTPSLLAQQKSRPLAELYREGFRPFSVQKKEVLSVPGGCRAPLLHPLLFCVCNLGCCYLWRCLVWPKLAKPHYDLGQLRMQNPLLHYLSTGSGPCPSLLPQVSYCEHSGVPTWRWQQPQNLVQGTLSNLIWPPRVFPRLSLQREFLTLCLTFSLILQDFNSLCLNVLLMFLQRWAWGGCKIAGLRTCSEGLTGAWKSRMKRSIHFDEMPLCHYFLTWCFLKNITISF